MEFFCGLKCRWTRPRVVDDEGAVHVHVVPGCLAQRVDRFMRRENRKEQTPRASRPLVESFHHER